VMWIQPHSSILDDGRDRIRHDKRPASRGF
jgi:hypothetical protein